MPDFFITFDSHLAHRTSWVRVAAPDYSVARQATLDHFGKKWLTLETSYHFNPVRYAMGELFAFSTDKYLIYERLPAREDV